MRKIASLLPVLMFLCVIEYTHGYSLLAAIEPIKADAIPSLRFSYINALTKNSKFT